MITAIRDVRRAKGLTLEEVARRCVPPTTAQTIGRLETGTRTVSVGWLNRIAAALGVEAADLVTLPDRPDVPVAAALGPEGARAPTRTQLSRAPIARGELVAVMVTAGVGDYRAGDVLWCERLAPERFGEALHRDVLAPQPGGRFVFGRLIGCVGQALTVLPPGAGERPYEVEEAPWLARAETLIRAL
jgi:transcriptional regulator with XRE-family HTH domain